MARVGLSRKRSILPAVVALALVLAGFSTVSAQSRHTPSKAKKKLDHLTIVNARFLDSEDGYPLPPNSSFYPGEKVYLVFNIGGFHISEYEYQMKISYRIDFVGPRGADFANSEAGTVAEEVYPQDESWTPVVRAAPRIPFHAEAGTYQIEISSKDELKPQEEVHQVLSFQVLGKEIGEADKLTIRNFSFLRSEEGEPIPQASYHQGDALFGSFYITGFDLGQDNSFDVNSQLQVVNSDGEVLYSFSPQAEEGRSFYPRRWLPGRFRVNLDKDIPTGQYSIVLLVQDGVGKQQSETRYPFEIQ